MKTNVAIVIPNWNGKDRLKTCLDAVFSQTKAALVIVSENGSTDGSLEYIQQNYPDVDLVVNEKNLGFAGGVNGGIRRAKELGVEFVALLNNDAVVDKHWLEQLLNTMENGDQLGAVACKLLSADRSRIDSTGDFYSIWGLPFNRQRDEDASKAVDTEEYVFAPCAGAALYRLDALMDAGLFDEDFFAYHEDSDIHFRLQLRGWKTKYNPRAVSYHATGSTSSKIPGFTTYQTCKNLPLLFWKNVPARLVPTILPRFTIAYTAMYMNSLFSGRGWPATKGMVRALILLPKKLMERRIIQKNRKVSVSYIRSIIVPDLPLSATKLRRLRSLFTGKR